MDDVEMLSAIDLRKEDHILSYQEKCPIVHVNRAHQYRSRRLLVYPGSWYEHVQIDSHAWMHSICVGLGFGIND